MAVRERLFSGYKERRGEEWGRKKRMRRWTSRTRERKREGTKEEREMS